MSQIVIICIDVLMSLIGDICIKRVKAIGRILLNDSVSAGSVQVWVDSVNFSHQMNHKVKYRIYYPCADDSVKGTGQDQIFQKNMYKTKQLAIFGCYFTRRLHTLYQEVIDTSVDDLD